MFETLASGLIALNSEHSFIEQPHYNDGWSLQTAPENLLGVVGKSTDFGV